ncbi:16S rRNA (guanine(966)-N(2))-methyltransferase RsmD [Hoeflea sp.]|uniref:16S rRNA (guanine(966)-N(2))-methyltransferase RsmD n=1 Tax=Hoeflea sp. TaxID=1940281 RepID=UPI003B018157
MRIVGGSFKGRTLAGPRSHSIRPTTDRTRESLFNILAHGYAGAIGNRRVLDLFAGTGALGLEALSRGADFALFVEQSAEGRALLRSNIEKLGLQGRSKVFRRDATALGEAGSLASFDLVFADPPYGRGLGEKALRAAGEGGWLGEGALVLLEERVDVDPQPGDAFQPLETRSFGETAIRFYRFGAGIKHD